MRQRGSDSWELRAYLGTDPETGKRRYATRTVHGTKRAAQCALVELVDDASHAPRAGARSTALAQAERWEWIWMNPAAHASPPRHVPNEIRPPSPADVALLIAKASASDPALGAFIRLAASTGARRSQLLALRWENVDLERRRLSFTRALVEGPNGPVLAPTKTRRAYQVSLDVDTAAVLAQHKSCCDGVDDSFVFSHDSDGATPWKPNWATSAFIRLRRDCGIPRCRLHDLRHFMATEMLAAGVAIPIVAARLSHARASTTPNVYAHAVPGGDRNAAEQISDLLRDPPSPEGSGDCSPPEGEEPVF